MELADFKDLIVYEIYPNSFKDSSGDGFGDLKGIISKLDYIKETGFNAIWLNPVYDSPFKDGGYDVRDPFKVAERFGTNEDYKELITKAHELGIRIFTDLIPGHMSYTNDRFIESGKAYHNDSSDLFIWNDNVWNLEPGYRLISGMYDRNGCFMVNFFAHQPALNYGFNKIKYPSWQKSYKDVTQGRKYLESIMKYWLEFGVDGFRVDMADSLVKNDDEKDATIWLWQQIRQDLVNQGVKTFYMTSEWSVPKQSLKAGFDSDFVLDHWTNFSHFLFRQNDSGFEHPLLNVFDQKLFDKFTIDVNSRVKTAQKYNKQLSIISGNHDTWRIANYLSGDSLKLAYMFILTMPGVPYIYYGDEIGMHTDTSMPSFEGGYHRTGSRLPMRFDSTPNAGFSTGKTTFLPTLNSDPTLEEQERDPSSLYNFIKKMIKIRSDEKDLRSDDFSFINGKMAYKRGSIKVLMNLLDVDQKFHLTEDYKVLANVGDFYHYEDGFILKPHAGIVIKEEE